MADNIPQGIKEQFDISSEEIKYPTYPDDNFLNSISDNINLDNYSEEKSRLAFSEFNSIFSKIKNMVYEIISTNMHNIQEYCSNLGQKTMFFVYYLYITEKYMSLVEYKYYKEPKNSIVIKTFFCDEMMHFSKNSDFKLKQVYDKEFKEQEDRNLIHKVFNPIVERYNKLAKNKNEIGPIIIRTIKYITKYLFIPFEKELQKFVKIEKFYQNNLFKTGTNEENEIIMLNVIHYLKKIENLYLALYNTAILDKNDICNMDENSQNWKDLKKIIFRLIPKNAENIKDIIIESKNNIDFDNSMVSKINPEESTNAILFSKIKNYLYYKTHSNQNLIDSRKFMIANDIHKSLSYKKMFKKNYAKKGLPDIPFRRKIYVKKEFPPINRKYIERLVNFMKGVNLPINNNINLVDQQNSKDENLPSIYKDKLEDKSLKRKYVSITILHTEKLYFKNEKEEGIMTSIMRSLKKDTVNYPINNVIKKNVIMIYIHGGGFISSSTLLHENYLRTWCKELNIPIFGINYSLAPEYPYPEGLNDIYQGYMWILNHAREELNMNINHIILCGDSAGANLALGLNNLLISIKELDPDIGQIILLPELVAAFYPVTYLNIKNCSNSFLFPTMNPLLKLKAMKYILQSYLGDYKLENDPFVNVCKVNDFILDRMTCRVRIFFGSKDILRDDSVRLLNEFSKYNNKKKKNNKIDVRGYDVKYLENGFIGQNEEFQKLGNNLIIPEIETYMNSL